MKKLTKIKKEIDKRLDAETAGIIHLIRMVSETGAYGIAKENEKLGEMLGERMK